MPAYYQVSNKPADNKHDSLDTLGSGIKHQSPLPHTKLNKKIPASYETFFRNDNLAESIKNVFHDYHSPSFFAFHPLRHHKKLAENITEYLQLNPTIQDIYNYLIQSRKKLLSNFPNINMTGSFMKRMDFAIKKIETQRRKDYKNSLCLSSFAFHLF